MTDSFSAVHESSHYQDQYDNVNVQLVNLFSENSLKIESLGSLYVIPCTGANAVILSLRVIYFFCFIHSLVRVSITLHQVMVDLWLRVGFGL